MRCLGLVGLLGLGACGGAPKAAPIAPKEDAVDAKTAQKGAKDLVEELYEDVGHGNTDSLQALLDPKLMVLGPRRGDAVANRADAILALGKYADAKKKLHPTLKSAALGVFSSSGGHSAWGYDTLNANGEQWAVMVVMSGSNDLWSLDAAALGETPPVAKLKAELKKEAVVPPAASVTVKAEASASAAVEKFQKGLADQQLWGADLESTEQGVVIGPALGEVAHGKKDIKALWKKRRKANARAMLAGEISGAATRDGMLAWVSAPIMRAEDGEDAMPLRAFAVFARTGGDWKMIGLQESAALDTAGAGTAFKKFTPAAAAATPAEDKKLDDKKPEKKLKKKKPGADEDADPLKKVAKKKKPVEDADDDKPKKKRRPFGADDASNDDGDVPKKTMKKKKPVDDEAVTVDDDAPKKKQKKADADDDAPKKKKKKSDDDDVKIDD